MEFAYSVSLGSAAWRRFFDVCGALVGLVIAFPVLAAACCAILLEDGAPCLFAQPRVGRFERLFTLYKLRTFRKDACGAAPKVSDARDPRITMVGRVLRRTSIDELPQLFNVLRGEMSLIGPRPEMPIKVAGYERWQHMRHFVRPGLTGVWQTSGRALIPLESREATTLDLGYIRDASPTLDGVILARTLGALAFPRGAR
jgi:lipopolysaccharide/colanic/teichoic acid biosynthesis glycosyltransferase